MVEPSESKLSWFYLALSLGDAFRTGIRIDLQLYDSPTKFHPTKKHTYYHFL